MGADDSAASAAALAGAPAPATIYKAVATFDELGLSKELLSGVYAMKFTAPSKIQAQALPIIMAPKSDRQTVQVQRRQLQELSCLLSCRLGTARSPSASALYALLLSLRC